MFTFDEAMSGLINCSGYAWIDDEQIGFDTLDSWAQSINDQFIEALEST